VINYGDKSGAACAESEAGGYADYYDGGGRDDDDDKSSISSGEYVDEREALASLPRRRKICLATARGC